MNITREDRITGVLVGQACADALGMGYEFVGPPAKGEKAVMRKGALGFAPGEWTDDTQQAIVVAQAKADPTMVAWGLLGWVASRPRDIGSATSAVLGRAWNAEGVLDRSMRYGEHQAAKPRGAGWDPGMANGSLMRTGPVALAHLGNREAIAQAARAVSDVTHFDPTGYTGDACVLWTLAINEAITYPGDFRPSHLWAVFEGALTFVPQARREFWVRVIMDGLYGGVPAGRNGSAVGAFRVALNAVAQTQGYEDAIQRAISAGHDTDTTAAIAGQLAGAMYGTSGIPAEYLEIVHGMPGMVALDLAKLAVECAS